MSDGGATATGLKELRAEIEQLPHAVTAALKGVAHETALRIQARARQLLSAQTHGTGATAAAIAVVDESVQQRYVVDSKAPKGRPEMLPNWIEFGTRFQSAKPYMRPAGDAEDERYKSDSVVAALAAVAPLEKL